MSSASERQAKQREERLERMAEQIADGKLTVRKMTDAERARHPRPAKPRTRARTFRLGN